MDDNLAQRHRHGQAWRSVRAPGALSWWARMRYRLRFWREYEDSLNRRAEVENELFEMARGRKPLPTAADCRRMATKLGTAGSDQ